MLNRGARSEANNNTLQSERAERARKTRANEVSVGIHTSSAGGSGATVRNHRQGASEASVIEPHIYGMSEIYAFNNE